MLHITEFVVIHNGIITNYKEIKTYLVSCLLVFVTRQLQTADFLINAMISTAYLYQKITYC